MTKKNTLEIQVEIEAEFAEEVFEALKLLLDSLGVKHDCTLWYSELKK